MPESCCRDGDVMAEMGALGPVVPSVSQPGWCDLAGSDVWTDKQLHCALCWLIMELLPSYRLGGIRPVCRSMLICEGWTYAVSCQSTGASPREAGGCSSNCCLKEASLNLLGRMGFFFAGEVLKQGFTFCLAVGAATNSFFPGFSPLLLFLSPMQR